MIGTIVGHVHISNSISKLGATIPSVNLPPIETCDLQAGCHQKCYAMRGRFRFKNVKDVVRRNLDIWKNDPDGFERDVEIAAFPARFFRYHSSGDIPDGAYLRMMVRVAERCPGTSFLCFTKKFRIVNEFIDSGGVIPANLHIVYSAWGDFIPENPHNFPVAYVKFKDRESYIPKDAMPCQGYCGDCVQTERSCWDLKPGQSVCFDEH